MTPTTALLTVPEAAAYLNVGVRFIYRLTSERRIRFTKLGSHVRIARSDLDLYIEEHTIQTMP
ncbi:helix-turn-helix domain-containing protein [Rathayibacter sp. AY1H2]|uniref:helix-turn-helix domain-containing protein n=1 Tax=Rathayibacter sp. AY1H2 TaxID=2080566 RepID=UPI000CE729BB|nr:helix-turn-helix domain-containing protein [Rathayibacter sp. AY1H2]PPG83025.1 excisionase [Rathayibacter sp. AY1H2]